MSATRQSAIGIAFLVFAVAAMAASPAPVIVQRHYDNGQLAEVRSSVRGRENGAQHGWWPDGRQRYEYAYRDGLLDGISREWFPSGALWREQRYVAGHETGLQRMYWEDGRVRASYVARNGRRFGLMGTKGCVTRNDTLPTGLQ
jgi:antitoxin component YwqK of YwqJK toxin-antitoxin module